MQRMTRRRFETYKWRTNCCISRRAAQFLYSVDRDRKISGLILLVIYLKGRYPSAFYRFLFASENDYLIVTVCVAVEDGK